MTPCLHGYWRSTASYRVRIAVRLKGLAVEHRAVHLRRGEQNAPGYLSLNPQGRVPLWREGGFHVAQSLAIIEYLNELHPDPPLLPPDPRDRAVVREMALTIASDIQPLGNIAVLNELSRRFGATEPDRSAWARHFIEAGFEAIEARLARTPGALCFGDTPTLADVCLVPQIYNARRFAVDLRRFPLIAKADALLFEIPAFREASPENQPDAE